MTSTLIENTFSHHEFKIHHAFSPYNIAQFKIANFQHLKGHVNLLKKYLKHILTCSNF